MKEQPKQPAARPSLGWVSALAVLAALCAVRPALASDPELNPQRGGSDIDLNAVVGGLPGDEMSALIDNGTTQAGIVVHQTPQAPLPVPLTPVLTTLRGFDAVRIGELCAVDPERTDINCVDPPNGGFDHAAAGTGLRNTGSGAIQLRGVPVGAVPMAAWIYWGLIASSEESPQSLATAWFDGRQLTGVEVGTADEPCWHPVGGAQFYTHRASVLRFLRAGINGIYTVQTQLSAITTGTDPWLDTGSPPFAEGATLIVLYSHPNVPIDSLVYLSHGAAFLNDALEIDHDLDPPLPPGVCAFRHTRAGGDGQSSWEEQTLLSIDTKIGVPSNLVAVRGPVSSINPDADWQGTDGGPKNQLWDTQTSELTGSQLAMLSGGVDSYRVRYEPHPTGGPFKDCVVVAMHALTAFAENE